MDLQKLLEDKTITKLTIGGVEVDTEGTVVLNNLTIERKVDTKSSEVDYESISQELSKLYVGYDSCSTEPCIPVQPIMTIIKTYSGVTDARV